MEDYINSIQGIISCRKYRVIPGVTNLECDNLQFDSSRLLSKLATLYHIRIYCEFCLLAVGQMTMFLFTSLIMVHLALLLFQTVR